MGNKDWNDIMDSENENVALKKVTRWVFRHKVTLIVILVAFLVWLIQMGVIWVRGNQIDKLKAENAELAAAIEKLEDEALKYDRVAKTIILEEVLSEINSIGELATVEYVYTDVGEFSDPISIKNFKLPWTTKSFLAKWDGVIKGGIDLSEVKMAIDEGNKLITVTIPEAKILSHDLDEESFEVMKEKGGLFNPIKVEDVVEFQDVCEKDMKKKFIDRGLLEKAQENAEAVLRQLLEANPVIKENYTIDFA